MIVDQGLLNKVWHKWLIATYNDPTTINYHTIDYARVARRVPAAQKFELWLWAEGASIKRENKKCYLEFFDDTDAAAFALRHG